MDGERRGSDDARVREVAADGLVLDVRDGGPVAGEVVLLLHGFPQFGSCWAAVEPALHAAGLRTLAPDQRGYSPRARPRATEAYAMRHLVDDALAVADAAGADRVHVVGHDWGGAVAWRVAQVAPERVATLTVLSTPHPAALSWAMTHSTQAANSWYVALMQVPVLPERVLAAGLVERMMTASGLPADTARGHADRLRSADAVHGPVSWYRASMNPLGALDPRPLVRRLRPGTTAGSTAPAGPVGTRPGAGAPRGRGASSSVVVPTTYVWGQHDPALGRAAAERTARHVTGEYRFVELDAGHWLPETAAADVVAAVLDRVGGG